MEWPGRNAGKQNEFFYHVLRQIEVGEHRTIVWFVPRSRDIDEVARTALKWFEAMHVECSYDSEMRKLQLGSVGVEFSHGIEPYMDGVTGRVM